MTKKKVSIRYVGRRMLNEKLAFAFIDHRGKEVFFLKVKWPIIGHCYFAEAEGDSLSLKHRPDQDEKAEQANEQDVAAWEVQDALAHNDNQRRRVSARMQKNPPALERAVNAIQPLVKGLNFTQRRQLIEILVTRTDRNIP